jgi:NitT/TauT family transport system ATP-binding protein
VAKIYTAPNGAPIRVLDDINVNLTKGEFVSIVGPSGCGKSTLLRLISGLEGVSEGRIKVAGEDVNGPPPEMGFMFQRDTLLPWATVRENIAIALELNGTPKPDHEARIQELLALIGLEKHGHYRPAAISGGMRQRAALARLLAYAPALYLMDEPFGALDAMTKIAMGRELLRIWNDDRKTVVFITHDIEEAVGLSDRVLVMSGAPGRIMSEYVVDIPRPRDLRANRSTTRFRELCESIWNDIGLH